VLAEIKADEKLATIPVVVLTASTSEQDLLRAQALKADSYITKPVEFMGFLDVMREVESFHLFVVTLPPVPLSGDIGNWTRPVAEAELASNWSVFVP
jgi:chemotaxis family two-component system response regulator Rcp1